MKSLFGYLFCIGIAVLMAVMIDGKGGVLIAVILMTALIVSTFLKYYLRRKMTVSIECKHSLFSKGDRIDVKVRVDKHTRFPSPLLELELEASDQLLPIGETGARFAIAPNRDHKTITISFKAAYSGLSEIRLKRFELFDFLGLFNNSLVGSTEVAPIVFGIMPNVPDTGTQIDVIRTAADNTGFDDSDDETSETALGSTGMPGYEHRAYIPGDPLKKINWKMSSKRNIYMVRLDEKLSVTSQIFILDTPEPAERSVVSSHRRDIIIEGMLAMLSMLAMQGFETEVYYYLGGWQQAPIKAAGDVYLLAEKLAGLSSSDASERLPHDALKKGFALCFTDISEADTTLVSDLFSVPGLAFVVYDGSGIDTSRGDVWTCSDDYEFKHRN